MYQYTVIICYGNNFASLIVLTGAKYSVIFGKKKRKKKRKKYKRQKFYTKKKEREREKRCLFVWQLLFIE